MAEKAKKFYLGTGRRKTSVARVRICEGSGKIVVNGREPEHFFTEDKDLQALTGPLNAVEMRNRLDVSIDVKGGGITGQAGAACQGVARALKNMFNLTTTPAAPPVTDGQAVEGAPVVVTMSDKLRHSGFLTRDSRMKERKKYGRKGARKSFQFSKR